MTTTVPPQETQKGSKKTYQVLARKYRPQTFADLIGQEAMVRTLKNAFESDRIAHAFVMTGVRGVGKTTTARIIAKGLNCIGLDGEGAPTTEPCGACEHCRAIADGRHVDVMEMDAASRTGVDDIREIIDSVHYRAASARYKIYIIDEVHMLSVNAFNALLKTLEEPPEHVKFIFATTEIRKVPVTVLSRCQRFDLRRIESEVMLAHLDRIAKLEDKEVSDDALALIVRAAEGSVRDAMSLLDQAIAYGGGQTSVDQVRIMLGLADRGRGLDLFDLIMRGDTKAALIEASEQYSDGADPMVILRDLAEISHWISVLKVSPEVADDPTIAPDERVRGLDMAARLPMRALTRMWQMLLKALEELSFTPNAMMGLEMAIIRLTHVADLPDPETLIKKLQANSGANARIAPSLGGAAPQFPMTSPTTSSSTLPSHKNPSFAGSDRAVTSHQNENPSFSNGHTGGYAKAAGEHNAHLMLQPEAEAKRVIASFAGLLELVRENGDGVFLYELERSIRLVNYSPGRIEFEPAPGAAPDLAARLGQKLQALTKSRWGISVVARGGQPTVIEAREAEKQALYKNLAKNPLVEAVLNAFPGAEITKVNPAVEEGTNFIESVDDNWDPLEDI